MLRRALVAAMFVAAAASQAAAQNTVFIVRHAEKAAVPAGSGMMAEDPDLSDAGRARAETLASTLRSAEIKAIFATEFKRTQQTAAPLAKLLGIKVVTVNSNDTQKLVEMIRQAPGNVLVVGHSGSPPKIFQAMGIATAITIDESEYDNLFVVTTGPQPRMVRLHFR